MWTLAVLAGGCGHLVAPDRGPHGNLHAQLVEAPRLVSAPPATVVMIERDGARAIDPVAGKQRWRYDRQVVGHPVGSDTTIYLPLRGNRVAALDRATGTVRWIAALPGEALTGLAVAEPTLVAAVVGHDRADRTAAVRKRSPRHAPRSRLVALSTEDASILWERGSQARFGAPLAQGDVFIAPLADSVVALRMTSGREVARVALQPPPGAVAGASLHQLLRGRDGTIIVGGGNRFVNLHASTGGTAPIPQEIDTGTAVLFPDQGGMDAGYGEASRLQLALSFAATGEAPRSGVLLSRRALIAVRLSPDGRPKRPRWVHYHDYERREFVAMQVGKHRVIVVREDGAIVDLDAASGEVLHAWEGKARVRGALLLDVVDRPAPDDAPDPPTLADSHRALRELLREEDPRLLPAQMMAVDLLWRADAPRTRRWVHAVANKILGPWHTEAGQRLAARADAVRALSWGSDEPAELAERRDALARRPSFLAERSLSVTALAQDVVRSGSADMVEHIVAHLMHPATAAEDLPALVVVLGRLRGPVATEGLLHFVRSYHADPEVVTETAAVHVAVDTLATLIGNDDPVAKKAWATLDEARADPFTDPGLRVHIEQTLAALGPAAQSAPPARATP